MVRSDVTLHDKYQQDAGRLYMTGLQALTRIPLIQHRLDKAAGLNTAGFISGYRGSPLGGYDLELTRAQPYLQDHNIHFQPGVNEDLGATAVWGSQQVNLYPDATYDGVFGIWYGKGPGVDRSTDAIKHGNAAGSSKHGGVLMLVGDDHACKSSTFPHQSEHALVGCMVPILNPAGIQDALDYGLHGIAMSRYTGNWSALKVISDMADSSASIFTDPGQLNFKIPADFDMPEGGLNIRWPDPPVDQERRLIEHRLPAAMAYIRANNLDRRIFNPARKRLGIVTTGKSYMDTRQALDDLGINEKYAQDLGIVLYKVAMTWPLEPEGIKILAQDVDEILVIEEKRDLMEEQIKRILYNMPAGQRPRVIGKQDENGAPLLPSTYEMGPAIISKALVNRLKHLGDIDTTRFEKNLNTLLQHRDLRDYTAPMERKPWYCSGCPHNTSTVVPEGSRAQAGIGCHYMVMWMDRNTETFTQMGGEGVPWIGQAPFTNENHIFANLGDGTYFHSGLLAIRASVAAKVNITYKILYNDAVAMTGGQKVEGNLSVAEIARQIQAEGVEKIYIVTDEPKKYPKSELWPPGTSIHHRDHLDKIQKDLRKIEGVTALIYDQTCAAEKRRRRKRGLMEDPARHVLINEIVCEGCGDCGKKSNCLSILPVETDYGRKRQIDQSSCNKDYSCLNGFCPSFVTIEGGRLRKPATVSGSIPDLPEPDLPALDHPYSILVNGIGGTGIVTIGALLAFAAHLEDKGATTMDQTGLAQKGGAVTSHVRIAAKPEDVHTVRIQAGGADLVLGCDLLVAANGDALSRMDKNRTHTILNSYQTPTGAFAQDTEFEIPVHTMIESIKAACGNHIDSVDATGLAVALLGNTIAANLFILGYAWQKGLVPVSRTALHRAIEINGVAIEMNTQAFEWGRYAAVDLNAVMKAAQPVKERHPRFRYRKKSQTLAELIDRRTAALTRYQNAAYAARYLNFVNNIIKLEQNLGHGKTELSEAVARYAYKLMAYKDEYEVARLYTDGTFKAHVENVFEGQYKIKFHLAPPLFAPRNDDGTLKKIQLGGWVYPLFKILAKFRFLRGTPFDVFGYTDERRMERQLRDDYFARISDMAENLSPENYDLAVDIASIPEHIRGFGHVKDKHVEEAKKKEKELLARFK